MGITIKAPEGSWGMNSPFWCSQTSWLVATYARYGAGKGWFGKRFGKLAPKPVMDCREEKDMALGRFAVVAGSWRMWKAKTQWVVGIKKLMVQRAPLVIRNPNLLGLIH